MAALKLAQSADDLTTYVRHETGGDSSFEAAVSGAHCAGCIAKIEREMGYDAELRREVALLREALLRLGRGVAATN